MTGTGNHEHPLATRRRRVDAVAGERQAVMRRERARRRRQEGERRIERLREALGRAA